MYRYDEVGIDITCDLDDMDGGLHLNAHGAEKLTAYLGRYITEIMNWKMSAKILPMISCVRILRRFRDIRQSWH